MQQKIYYTLSLNEVEELVKKYLGIADPDYNLIADLGMNEYRWRNDTTHQFTVEPKADWIQPNHDQELAEAKARGRVDWEWELAAILNELGEAGELPMGNYLVEVSW